MRLSGRNAASGGGKRLKRRANQFEQWAVRILCAIALVFVGFGHQLPAIADDGGAATDLAHYVLPDGSLPTLCVTVSDDADAGQPIQALLDKEQHRKAVHSQGCEACRISASVLMPAPADAVGERLYVMAAAGPLDRFEAVHRRLYPPNTGPRAPPSAPILP